VTTAAAVTQARVGAQPAPVLRTYRFELIKLLAQWPIRLALGACWLGPALIVAIMSQQSSLPTDTVFGRWLSQTGWAGPVVVLAFACSWLLPLLTSVVAGDVFATEDRLGTWRHLLVAVRSPRRIFAAKALASLTVILLLAAGLAISGAVGGLAAVGDRPLVGLDGHLLEPGDAAGPILLAWAAALAPTLAFAAVGLLGSVALGRSPMGLVIPAVLALLLAVAQLLPMPCRSTRRPAELRLHRLARAVHRPGPDRPPSRRHRRQPRLGGGRHRAGLPAVHAPRLHRPGL
jgi:ABC-2 type transport system permease protein